MTKAEPHQLHDNHKAPKRTTSELTLDKNKAKTKKKAGTTNTRHSAQQAAEQQNPSPMTNRSRQRKPDQKSTSQLSDCPRPTKLSSPRPRKMLGKQTTTKALASAILLFNSAVSSRTRKLP